MIINFSGLSGLGIDIGYNTRTQIKRGTHVEFADMKPADIILFDWESDGVPNHVGFYAGGGQLLDEHGSNSDPAKLDPANQNVRITPFSDVHLSHIIDIRRIIQDNNTIINKPGEIIPIPGDDVTDAETSIEKAILLTADFEGNDGYATLAGNFDGAGLSLGIIQFNIKSDSLQPLLRKMLKDYPDMSKNIFGDEYEELTEMLEMTLEKQLSWAKSINDSSNNIIEPWKSHFITLCHTSEFQAIQRKGIQSYIDKAYEICSTYGLTTERGLALAFDIAVQNGSVKTAAQEIIQGQLTESTSYKEKLAIIANAVADASNYPNDVRSRKMTIVNGSGTVHGKQYNTDDYGITDNNIIE